MILTTVICEKRGDAAEKGGLIMRQYLFYRIKFPRATNKESEDAVEKRKNVSGKNIFPLYLSILTFLLIPIDKMFCSPSDFCLAPMLDSFRVTIIPYFLVLLFLNHFAFSVHKSST